MADRKNWPFFWWIKEPAKATEADFMLNMGCAIALGLFLGWMCFGTPLMLAKGLSFGSAADWLAAAGTWVIGAGAWKYARDSHLHNVSEQKTRKLSGLSSIAEKCEALTRLNNTIGVFANRPVNEATNSALQMLCRMMTSNLNDVSWDPEDRAAAPAHFVAAMREIVTDITVLKEGLAFTDASVDEEHGDPAAPISQHLRSWLDSVREASQRMAGHSDQLLERVNGLRDRIYAGMT